MNLNVEIDNKDFHDWQSRVEAIGNQLNCGECMHRIILIKSSTTRADIILNLAKHEHGYDT